MPGIKGYHKTEWGGYHAPVYTDPATPVQTNAEEV